MISVFKIQIQPKAKDMMQEKTSGIKLHIGVDVLGLPHSIMVTTADVTDRNGSVDMVSYYCDNTDNLSHVKKLLADGGYTGQNFADEIKKFQVRKLKWLNAMNSIIFRLFLSAGLWNAPLAGLINAADFGKTVRDFFIILFRCFLLLLFVLFSEDTKQALKI